MPASAPLPFRPIRRACARAPGRILRPSKHADPGSRTVVSGSRYYSPSQGRFLGRDPIEEQGGLHLYAFCVNNPVNKWDVLGMSIWDIVRSWFQDSGSKGGKNDAYGPAVMMDRFEVRESRGDGGRSSGTNLEIFEKASNSAGETRGSGDGGGSDGDGPNSGATTTRGGNTISSATFTGDRIVVKDANGNTVRVAPASSGNPGITDTTLKDKGPIPPGMWFVDPNDISPSGAVRTTLNTVGIWDWGTARVRLDPYIGTDTQGRTDLFIHGGTKPGSNGCIDIGTADSWFFPLLKQQPDPVLIIVEPAKPPKG